MDSGMKIKLGLSRARPGYSFDLVSINKLDTHMVLLFLLKTVWDIRDTSLLYFRKKLFIVKYLFFMWLYAYSI